MKTYKATEAGYLSKEGRFITAGEVFTTAEFDAAEKAPGWAEPLSATEAKREEAIADAADPRVDNDPDYSKLTIQQLQSVAAGKKIAFEGLSKKDLIAALQAEYAPTA